MAKVDRENTDEEAAFEFVRTLAGYKEHSYKGKEERIIIDDAEGWVFYDYLVKKPTPFKRYLESREKRKIADVDVYIEKKLHHYLRNVAQLIDVRNRRQTPGAEKPLKYYLKEDKRKHTHKVTAWRLKRDELTWRVVAALYIEAEKQGLKAGLREFFLTDFHQNHELRHRATGEFYDLMSVIDPQIADSEFILHYGRGKFEETLDIVSAAPFTRTRTRTIGSTPKVVFTGTELTILEIYHDIFTEYLVSPAKFRERLEKLTSVTKEEGLDPAQVAAAIKLGESYRRNVDDRLFCHNVKLLGLSFLPEHVEPIYDWFRDHEPEAYERYRQAQNQEAMNKHSFINEKTEKTADKKEDKKKRSGFGPDRSDAVARPSTVPGQNTTNYGVSERNLLINFHSLSAEEEK